MLNKYDLEALEIIVPSKCMEKLHMILVWQRLVLVS